VALIAMLSLGCVAGSLAAAVETSTQASPGAEALDAARVSAPYEVLQPDASWCGPRVLYFFSVYLGKPRPLDEIVALCRTDEQGLTSLADLSKAAESLGLLPTPVKCSVDDLAEFNGPAIISVSRQQEGPVHFIGVLRREEESFVILDPSVSVRTYRISRPFLAASFTGHAILLGEGGRSRARRFSTPIIALLSGVWILVVVCCLWPGLPRRAIAYCRSSRGTPRHEG
jgi:ABC-type bacteriocin/lantibiotic exporter with double-glycine peptidase domain